MYWASYQDCWGHPECFKESVCGNAPEIHGGGAGYPFRLCETRHEEQEDEQ